MPDKGVFIIGFFFLLLGAIAKYGTEGWPEKERQQAKYAGNFLMIVGAIIMIVVGFMAIFLKM